LRAAARVGTSEAVCTGICGRFWRDA